MSKKHAKENKENLSEDRAPDEAAELKGQLQRLQAEFENYRKRTEKETGEFRQRATSGLVKELLPVIDHLELALGNAEQHDGLYKGVALTLQQLKEVLADHGVEEIPAEGKLDPRLHEAMLTEEGEEKNTITEVLQKGYTQHGTVLRTTKVKVTR